MTSRDNSYIISTYDVFGDKTVLTRECYEYHTAGPDREAKDVETRIKAAKYIPCTVRWPDKVYKDTGHPDTRARYIRLLADTSISQRITALVVVVESSRRPKEIVTWLVKRSLKGENLTGGILYDSITDTESIHQV